MPGTYYTDINNWDRLREKLYKRKGFNNNEVVICDKDGVNIGNFKDDQFANGEKWRGVQGHLKEYGFEAVRVDNFTGQSGPVQNKSCREYYYGMSQQVEGQIPTGISMNGMITYNTKKPDRKSVMIIGKLGIGERLDKLAEVMGRNIKKLDGVRAYLLEQDNNNREISELIRKKLYLEALLLAFSKNDNMDNISMTIRIRLTSNRMSAEDQKIRSAFIKILSKLAEFKDEIGELIEVEDSKFRDFSELPPLDPNKSPVKKAKSAGSSPRKTTKKGILEKTSPSKYYGNVLKTQKGPEIVRPNSANNLSNNKSKLPPLKK